MHRVTTLAVVAVMGLLSACDTSASPTVAGIGGGTSINGRQPLIVTPSSITLAAGSSFQLATNAPPGLQPLLQWASLDETVVTVSPSGMIEGVGAGTATITVNYSDDTANVGTSIITVIGSPPTAIRLP
jgi:uncharacterized protein YjdB